MSDHLPECSHSLPVVSPLDFHLETTHCICDRLRACEQRKDAEHTDCRCNELEAMAIVDGKYESVAINGQLLERRDVVLQEARDAVAALDVQRAMATGKDGLPHATDLVSRDEALDAIDALRGESA